MNRLLGCVLLFLICSCKQTEKDALFELMPDTGIDFANTVTDGQIENSFYYRNYYNGGGVAIGDLNNDGRCDILFTSNMGENKLYLNKGDWKFEDITAGSGMKQDSMWSTGVMMVDINHDGWLDIYVCNSGHMKSGNRRNKLYINNQKLGFTEEAAKYGLDISAYSTQVSFFDYDQDGDLDCFMINNSPMPINNLGYTNRRDLPDAQWPVSDFLKGGGDHLFRNDDGKFTEVSAQTGIHGTLISFGLGVSVGDINMDGYPDVYVANDSYERDYLYINQRNGTFRDELEDWMEQNSFSSMGADLADVNNDGYMDVFTTDMLPDDDYRLKTLGAFDNIDLYNHRIKIGLYRQFMKNCLFVNNKDGKFLETANYSGVSASDWSWGALFFDADNDGLNDIYVCNGVNRDVTNLDFMDFFANDLIQKMVISGRKENVDSVLQHIPINPVANKTFRNLGNFRFQDIGVEWGLGQVSLSNGAAYGDLDNDGDLDLVVNNQNMPAFLYRNKSREENGHNYLGFVLKGTEKNRYAIGSKIRVYQGSQVFYRELYPSRGFQSAVDYKQIIGLGTLTAVDSVQIIWPDQTYTSLPKPAINQVMQIDEMKSQRRPFPERPESATPATSTFLQPVENGMDKHTEDDYIDYYYERNLPQILSREGPALANGDVDGDGLDDVFVGGAKGQEGQLYLQTRDGRFTKMVTPVFRAYADFEDVAARFFDADKDGDLDLFVGSGGNTSQPGSREIQHRLYKNDGKGNFQVDLQAFPLNNMNISVAVANDFDGDGDLDLFVGGRNVPFSYGLAPVSYLYQNDGTGHFRDVTAQLCPALLQAGMVTDATWADVDGDGRADLIVTGEWMHTRIFRYDTGTKKMNELTGTGLDELDGWWQAIASADVNGDGHADLVIGNVGRNFYLQPSAERPVKLWLNDFDQNGSTEQFLTRTIAGPKDVPVFLKREITDQFPGLKKQNLKHSDYATKSFQELFPADLVKKSKVLDFNYPASVIALGDGKGHFTVSELPLEVQLSSVNAIDFTDMNSDGKPDLLLGGNLFTFPPQFGRLDASYGHLMMNDGKGNFNLVPNKQSGLLIKEEVRGIAELRGAQGRSVLVVRNSETPLLYRINDGNKR